MSPVFSIEFFRVLSQMVNNKKTPVIIHTGVWGTELTQGFLFAHAHLSFFYSRSSVPPLFRLRSSALCKTINHANANLSVNKTRLCQKRFLTSFGAASSAYINNPA